MIHMILLKTFLIPTHYLYNQTVLLDKLIFSLYKQIFNRITT